MPDWVHLFTTYRVVTVRNEEVVQGVLHPAIDAEHPAVREALAGWQGMRFVRQTPSGTEVTLVRRLRPASKERWWLHALLFVATAITTTAAGAVLLGYEPFLNLLLPIGPFHLPFPVGIAPGELVHGWVFSLPLLAILLGHEMGHYLVARRYGMDVSPPYFIPSPVLWLNFIGTFGAFIRLRSPMMNRAVLLDVGSGGPLASFVLSIPAVLIGVSLSRVVEVGSMDAPTSFAILVGTQPVWLGGSLLFDGLVWLMRPEGGILLLHPLAFAGWIGLFVTALNLFPLAQLDGGHILYSLIGRWQRFVGIGFLALLIILGRFWEGWWLWAALILLIGRGSIRHPSVWDPDYPVVGVRRWVGWLCVLLFAVTFVAIPLQI